jgi:hypothetical protein
MQVSISWDLSDEKEAESHQHASNGRLYYDSMSDFAKYLLEVEGGTLNKSQTVLLYKIRHQFFKCMADNNLDVQFEVPEG